MARRVRKIVETPRLRCGKSVHMTLWPPLYRSLFSKRSVAPDLPSWSKLAKIVIYDKLRSLMPAPLARYVMHFERPSKTQCPVSQPA
jgi:hypothetical protein